MNTTLEKKSRPRIMEEVLARLSQATCRVRQLTARLIQFRLFNDSVRQAARIYISGVILVGLTLLAFSLFRCASNWDIRWLYLAGLTLVGSFFPVTLPNPSSRDRGVAITISDIFIFTAIPFLGTEAAVTIAAVDAVLGNLRLHRSIRPYKYFFNVAQLSAVTFVTGTVFELLAGGALPLQREPRDIVGLLLAITACSLCYFLLNSGAVALAISLVTDHPLTTIWKEHFLWTTLTNFPGTAVAAAIFVSFGRAHYLAIATILPIGVILYYAYRMHLNELKSVHKYLNKMNDLFHSTIASLAMAIDAKDEYTYGHIHRVQALTLGLAKHCGVTDENELQALRAAALLHDVGKLAVPEHILNKPSKLNASELEKMRAHVVVGANILERVPFPYPVVPIVRNHHEKWDGTGYPDGLKGEEIPVTARILSVVDCYDALSYDRPYRPRLSHDEALALIASESGKSFDPAIVKILLQHIDELESELKDNGGVISEAGRTVSIYRSSAADKVTELDEKAFQDLATAAVDFGDLEYLAWYLNSAAGLIETSRRVLRAVSASIPAEAAALFLINRESQNLVSIVSNGEHPCFRERVVVRLREGVTGWVGANGQPILNGPAEADFGYVAQIERPLKHALSVPLATDGGVIGVVTVYACKDSSFHAEQLRALQIISFYGALSINNALIRRKRIEPENEEALNSIA